MALITTPGGSTSNSYVSASDCDQYFNAHWNLAKSEAWAALSSKQKERLLLTSCSILETLRFLDDEYTYGGLPTALIADEGHDVTVRRYTANQRLSFPRNVDDGQVPQEVKDAQCEQAIFLVTFDESALAQQYQGIVEESVVVGSIRSYTNYGRVGTMIAPMAIELLRPFLRNTKRLRRS